MFLKMYTIFTENIVLNSMEQTSAMTIYWDCTPRHSISLQTMQRTDLIASTTACSMIFNKKYLDSKLESKDFSWSASEKVPSRVSTIFRLFLFLDDENTSRNRFVHFQKSISLMVRRDWPSFVTESSGRCMHGISTWRFRFHPHWGLHRAMRQIDNWIAVPL